MNFVSDALTIGLVLILLFGSIALYLYTRIQHSEQKINLLESILLDLKMSNEIKSYTELPADEDELEHVQHKQGEHSSAVAKEEPYTPFDDEQEEQKQQKQEEQEQEQQEEQHQEEVPLIRVLDNEEVEHAKIKSDSVPSVSIDMPLASSSLDQKSVDSKVNYESMSLKELQAAARAKGITGVHTKAQLIKALKAVEHQDDSTVLSAGLSTGLSGFLSQAGQNSFIETSASLSE